MSELQANVVRADASSQAVLKNPWVATALALLFGGLAGFYFGVRRGLASTLAWLYFLHIILRVALFGVTTAICLVLVQFAFAVTTYRYCTRRNAALARTVGGVPDGPPGPKSRNAMNGNYS